MTPAEGAPTGGAAGFVKANARLIIIAAVVLVVLAIVVADVFASQPTFWSRYSDYSHSYSTLQGSAHKGLACTECHTVPGGAVAYDAALVGDFYVGLFGKPSSPTFIRFSAPSRDACLKCHAEDWSMDASKTTKVPHPAHLRVLAETRDCVTCHRWIGHQETYMQQHKKMPFSVVCASFQCHVGVKPPSDCGNCHHQLQPSLDAWKQNHPSVVRAYGPNSCLENAACHKVDQCITCHTTGKTPQLPGVINASTVSDIERAHVKPDWLTQHGTFALQDQKKCLTCHVTQQECQDCHSHRPPFHGTDNTQWIGTQHGPIAKGDPRRCFECHKSTQCNDCHTQFQAKDAPQYPANAGQ